MAVISALRPEDDHAPSWKVWVFAVYAMAYAAAWSFWILHWVHVHVMS